MIVEERWLGPHERVIIVSGEDGKVYSIDYYERLDGKSSFEGASVLELEGSGVKVAEVNIGGGCRAVVLETRAGLEVIGFRLYTNPSKDPAGGDPGRAKSLCLDLWRRFKGALDRNGA